MLEAYAGILASIVIVTGTLMALSYIPQIHKMYRRKSSADIAVSTYFVILVGAFIWMLYGLSINDFAIVVPNVAGVLIMIVCIGEFYYYKKK